MPLTNPQAFYTAALITTVKIFTIPATVGVNKWADDSFISGKDSAFFYLPKMEMEIKEILKKDGFIFAN